MAGEGQFKSSLFGFGKQDVADYIENSAKRYNILKNEKEKLDLRCTALEKELTALTSELDSLKTERNLLEMKLSSAEEQASAALEKANRLEGELSTLSAGISEYRDKAAIYDAAKDRIAGLELNASKRAADIEQQAEKHAADIARTCEAYIASVKLRYTKVSDEARQSSEYIITELNRLSDRLSVLSALLGEKAEAFDFISSMGSETDNTETGALGI